MKQKQTGNKAEQNRRKKIKRQIARTNRRDEKDFLHRLMKHGRVLEMDIESGVFN